MLVIFSLAGFLEVASYGQLSAFTPLYLPRIGVAAADVAFWVGVITSLANLFGLPFLPFWGALADRYGRKPLIIRSFIAAFFALGVTAVAPPLRLALDGVAMVIRSPRLRAPLPALLLLSGGWILAFISVPLVAARLYAGADLATVVGVVLGGGGLVTIAASPGSGALADRFGHWRVLIAGGAVLVLVWLLPFFTRDLVVFAILWAVANGLSSGVFSVSFNVISGSASETASGRVMRFAVWPGYMGYVGWPRIGSVLAPIDVFLVFPAAAVLTAVGLAATAYARTRPPI